MFVNPRPDHIGKQPKEIGGGRQWEHQRKIIRVQAKLCPSVAHAQEVNIKRIANTDVNQASGDNSMQQPTVFSIQLLNSRKLAGRFSQSRLQGRNEGRPLRQIGNRLINAPVDFLNTEPRMEEDEYLQQNDCETQTGKSQIITFHYPV